jgi:hypothetical protein
VALPGRVLDLLALGIVEEAARVDPRQEARLADRRLVRAHLIDVPRNVGVAGPRIGERDLEPLRRVVELLARDGDLLLVGGP